MFWKKLVKNKDRWKASQLITINNYNRLRNDLPSESLSSAQLQFVKTDNQKTKMKGNLLVIDKKIKNYLFFFSFFVLSFGLKSFFFTGRLVNGKGLAVTGDLAVTIAGLAVTILGLAVTILGLAVTMLGFPMRGFELTVTMSELKNF